MKVTHHCDECGDQIDGDFCAEHPGAPIVSVATEMSALARLQDLAVGYLVKLTHDGTDWWLVITLKAEHEHNRVTFEYVSTDLERLINHAWAGAPEGRV